jgi:hypothetical protein
VTYAEADDAAICEVFASKVYAAYILTSSLSYIIILFNYILTQLCIAAIDWVGYKTES